MARATQKDFGKAIETLADPDAQLTAATIYSLSDLDAQERAVLADAWPGYPAARRRELVKRLVEVGEHNFELDFEAVFWLALDDADEDVRTGGVEGMWISESTDYMDRLIEMVSSDPAASVRAAAASDLGRFVLMGEFEEIDEADGERAQDVLVEALVHHDTHPDVRRRALESIANCGRQGVAEWIEDAYAEPAVEMRVSALFAMGRTCDMRWEAIVLDELQSDEPEMVFEAARAAGELELQRAVPNLADLLWHEDRETQLMALWALGEIGGDEASEVLMLALESAPDEDFAEAVEEALDAASLVGGDLDFDLLNFEDMDE
jgi:HEAT repeat protein